MTSLFHSALHTFDAGLENVGLLADAATRSAAPVPAVTSDYSEQASESWIHKSIDAIRGQFQRGLPIDTPPLQLIVSLMTTLRPICQILMIPAIEIDVYYRCGRFIQQSHDRAR